MPDPTLPPGPWCWRNFGGAWGLYTEDGGAVVVLIAGTASEDDCWPTLLVRDGEGRLVPITPDHPVARALAAVPALIAACKEALDEITVLVPGRAADPISRKLEAALALARHRKESC